MTLISGAPQARTQHTRVSLHQLDEVAATTQTWRPLSLAALCIPAVGLGQALHQLDEVIPTAGLPLDDLLAVALLLWFGIATLRGAASAGESAAEERGEAVEVVAGMGSGGRAALRLHRAALRYAALPCSALHVASQPPATRHSLPRCLPPARPTGQPACYRPTGRPAARRRGLAGDGGLYLHARVCGRVGRQVVPGNHRAGGGLLPHGCARVWELPGELRGDGREGRDEGRRGKGLSWLAGQRVQLTRPPGWLAHASSHRTARRAPPPPNPPCSSRRRGAGRGGGACPGDRGGRAGRLFPRKVLVASDGAVRGRLSVPRVCSGDHL